MIELTIRKLEHCWALMMDREAFEHRAQSIIDRSLEPYFHHFGMFSSRLYHLRADGIGAEQFEVYRDNFFHRTETTMTMLTLLLHSMAKRDDIDQITFNLVLETLADESGLHGGDMHRTMLEASHNDHGTFLYGLPRMRVSQAQRSPHILPTVIRYRTVQQQLYESADLPLALGAFLAQETAANSMLGLFRDIFFEPASELYRRSGEDFSAVTHYFNAHLGGTEEEHAERARACVIRTCQCDADLMLLESGMNAFLSIQTGIWRELALALELQPVNHELVA